MPAAKKTTTTNSAKVTTTTKTTKANDTQTEALLQELASLRQEVATLRSQIASQPSAPGDYATRQQVVSVLRSMGCREHMLSSAGLK